jgi:hypothetical protein
MAIAKPSTQQENIQSLNPNEQIPTTRQSLRRTRQSLRRIQESLRRIRASLRGTREPLRGTRESFSSISSKKSPNQAASGRVLC